MTDFQISRRKLSQEWDVVVIGAGPAGAFAACLLAKRFPKVLLIDKQKFPRGKVCGCCLNSAAVQLLKINGLETLLEQTNAVPLTGLNLYENGQLARISLSESFSLSRQRFDGELVDQACRLGANFLSNTNAEVGAITDSAREVVIRNSQYIMLLRSQMVIVADGLNGRALSKFSEFDADVAENSRFGCGTIVSNADQGYEAGRIYMACADEGYVGLVKLEDGSIDIAAAFDKTFAREAGSSASAVAKILVKNNLPVPVEIFTSHWNGTESLTRTRKTIAAERVFVVGDACGYAEPFTGEGIAWALTSAAAVLKHVEAGKRRWSDELIERWQKDHSELILKRQKRSIFIAKGLRSSLVRNIAMPLIATFPAAASSVVSLVSNGSKLRSRI